MMSWRRCCRARASCGRLIAEGIAGASPTVGREVAWRATGDADAPRGSVPVIAVPKRCKNFGRPWKAASGRRDVWLEKMARGSVGLQRLSCPFSPWLYTQRQHQRRPRSLLCGTSEATRRTMHLACDAYAGLRQQAAAQLARARRRVERQMAASAGDVPDAGAVTKLRTEAEWLLALHTQLTPGQTVLEVDLGEGEPLRIALDPALSPVEQAQRKFKRGGQIGTRAAEFVPTRRAQLTTDLGLSRPTGNRPRAGRESAANRHGRQRVAKLWAVAPTPRAQQSRPALRRKYCASIVSMAWKLSWGVMRARMTTSPLPLPTPVISGCTRAIFRRACGDSQRRSASGWGDVTNCGTTCRLLFAAAGR